MEVEEAEIVAPEKPKLWGPFSGIFLGLIIFSAAQLVALFAINILAEFDGVDVRTYYNQNKIVASFVGSTFLALVSVGLVYIATKSYGLWNSLKLKKPTLDQLFWVLPGVMAYIAISGIIYTLVKIFLPNVNLEEEQTLGFEAAQQSWQMVIAFVALVILAPISEEILFRGYTFQGVRRNTHWVVAAVVSASLFGLAHWQINVAMDTFALAIVACWLLEKTGSLWPAILLHIIKNLIAFTFLFVIGK